MRWARTTRPFWSRGFTGQWTAKGPSQLKRWGSTLSRQSDGIPPATTSTTISRWSAWAVRIRKRSGDRMEWLHVLKGARQGERVALDKDTLVLGRSPDCQVVIPVTSVSRQHARLVRVQEKWYVEDMQSRNGTFLNNQPVTTRTPLRHNDRIRICRSEEHTSELQSLRHLVCRLLLEKKK